MVTVKGNCPVKLFGLMPFIRFERARFWKAKRPVKRLFSAHE